MQTCFFAISGVLPRDEAIAEIKDTIKKTYGKRGETVLQQNYAGVDTAIAELFEVKVPASTAGDLRRLPASAGLRSRLRQAGHGDDDRGQGRLAARQRHAGRRHLPDRDRALREEEHRAVHPDLGSRHLHPVRPLLPGLPARGDPHQGLPHIGTRKQAGRLSVGALQRQGISRLSPDRPGRPRRLHRLRRLRRCLPGQKQGDGQAQGHQHGTEARPPRSRAGQLRFLPRDPRDRPQAGQVRGGQGLATAPAALRVLRRLPRLRRDALSQADESALRRPRHDRQRHRLLIDLRRQPAHDALRPEQAGQGPDLE